MRARVIDESPLAAVRAFAGREYVKYELRPVPEGYEDAARGHDLLAVEDAPVDEVEYPIHTGGGWYELPDGDRVRGHDAALEAMEA